MTEQPPDLTTIRGIGPKSAEHLRKTGVEDVDQVAQLTPARLLAKLRTVRASMTEADAQRIIGAARALSHAAPTPAAPDPRDWTVVAELGVSVEQRTAADGGIERRISASTEGVEEPLEVTWEGTDLVGLTGWIAMLIDAAATPAAGGVVPAAHADAERPAAASGNAAAPGQPTDIRLSITPAGRSEPVLRLPADGGTLDVPEDVDLLAILGDGEVGTELVGLHDYDVGARRRRLLDHAAPCDRHARFDGVHLDPGAHRLALVLAGTCGAQLVELDVTINVATDRASDHRSEPGS